MATQLEIQKQLQSLLPAAARAKAQAGNLNAAFSAGITSGFGVLSIRGKVWRQKYQGEERIVLEPDGRTPRFKLEIVMVKASDVITKTWYEKGYVEGARDAPDCFSLNGVTPELTSPKLQNKFCKTCKWNQWGSSRAAGGTGKGKDCSDTKRLAVVFADNIRNELMGGPMLLRVPPASLQEVDVYARGLTAMGIPLESVVTEIDFDPTAQYPKLRLRAKEALSEEQYAEVEEVMKLPIVDRILNSQAELMVTTDGIDETRADDPGIPPIQQAQAAPAAFRPMEAAMTPHPVPNPPKPVPPPHPMPEPAPAPEPIPMPAPAPELEPIPPQPEPQPNGNDDMATADEDGVLMEEVPDAQRDALRAAKLTEVQINAALGPPKMRPVPAKEAPTLPDNDQVRALRAAGIPDDKILTILKGLEPVATASAAPAPAVSQPVKNKGGRPRKVPLSTVASAPAPAVVSASQEAQPELKAASPNGSGNGEIKHPEAVDGTPSMPADLEELLDNMLGQQPK
jgi:hypothetical protein